jgi:hypothetical protein
MAFRCTVSPRQRNAIGLFKCIVGQSGMHVWGEVDSWCSYRAVTRRWFLDMLKQRKLASRNDTIVYIRNIYVAGSQLF